MINASDLPNDIDALKALLLARDEKILGLEAQLNTRATEIERLKLMIAKLRRMQFGRKSEKLDYQIEQLELQLEDLQAVEAEAERECRKRTGRLARSRCAGRCRTICHATKKSTRLTLKHARPAVAVCALWAKT